MKNSKYLIIALMLFGLLLAGCAVVNNATGSGVYINPANAVGWVVGNTTGGYGLILHTVDGGTTWTRQGSSDSIPDANISEVCAVDNNTAWVIGSETGGYGLVLRTTDGGATWIRKGTSADMPFELIGLKALSNDVAWVCGTQGYLLKTVDGGTTWTRQGSGIFTSDECVSYITAADENHLWLTGYHPAINGDTFIYYSADGGSSWTQQAAGNPFLQYKPPIDIFALDTNNVWVVGVNDLVFYTGNGGASWESISWFDDPIGGLAHSNGVVAFDSKTVRVARDFASAVFTSSGGSTWDMISVLEASGAWLIRVTGFSPDVLWFSGINPYTHPVSGAIVRTLDGGKTWTAQTMPVVDGLRGISFVGAKK